MIIKWWEWFLNYFLWFPSSFWIDKSFMICIGKIYETHGNNTKNNLQQPYRKISILSVGCISELFGQKCKVKKSNCIPPDSSDAILHCNKMVSWLSENLGSDSSITLTARYFEMLISIQSPIEANYVFSGCHCWVKPYFVFNIPSSWCLVVVVLFFLIFHLYVKQTIWWYYKGSELFPTTRWAEIYHF